MALTIKWSDGTGGALVRSGPNTGGGVAPQTDNGGIGVTANFRAAWTADGTKFGQSIVAALWRKLSSESAYTLVASRTLVNLWPGLSAGSTTTSVIDPNPSLTLVADYYLVLQYGNGTGTSAPTAALRMPARPALAPFVAADGVHVTPTFAAFVAPAAPAGAPGAAVLSSRDLTGYGWEADQTPYANGTLLITLAGADTTTTAWAWPVARLGVASNYQATLRDYVTIPNGDGTSSTVAIKDISGITSYTAQRSVDINLPVPVVTVGPTPDGGANRITSTVPSTALTNHVLIERLDGPQPQPGDGTTVWRTLGTAIFGYAYTTDAFGTIARGANVAVFDDYTAASGKQYTYRVRSVASSGFAYSPFAVNLFTNPSGEASAGTVVVATNLATDPAGTTTTFMGNEAGNAAVNNSTTQQPGLSRATSVNATPSNGQTSVSTLISAAMPVTGSTTYVESADVYNPEAVAVAWQIWLRWYTTTSTGSEISNLQSANIIVPAGGSARLSFSGAAPATAAYVRVNIRRQPNASGTVATPWYTTAFRVTPSTGNLAEDIAYFDGSTVALYSQSFAASVDGWSQSGGATAPVLAGGGLTVTANGTVSGYTGVHSAGTIPVIAGQSYVVSADVLLNTAFGDGVRLFVNGTGTNGAVIAGSAIVSTPGIATRIALSFTATATGVIAITASALSTQSIPSSASFVLKNVRMTPASGNLADDSQYVSDFACMWTGTANQSVSNRVGILPASTAPRTVAIVYRAKLGVTDGLYSAVIQATAAGTASAILSGTNVATLVPIAPRTTVTASMDMVDLTSARSAQLVIDWYNGGIYLSSSLGASTVGGGVGSVTRRVVSDTAPASATGFQVFAQHNGVAAGERFAHDAFLLSTTGSTVYFDGSDTDMSWSGTPNASSSYSGRGNNLGLGIGTTTVISPVLAGPWLHDPAAPGYSTPTALTAEAFPYQAGERKEDIGIEQAEIAYRGRTYPVMEYGDGETWQKSLSVRIPPSPKHAASRERWKGWRRARKTLIYRDNRGTVTPVAIATMSLTDERNGGTLVDTTLNAVDYVSDQPTS